MKVRQAMLRTVTLATGFANIRAHTPRTHDLQERKANSLHANIEFED